MPSIHHVQLSADISIDAATEDTYKKLRPQGSWQTLMKNLDFVASVPAFSLLGISMVVQQENYLEMEDFVKLGE